MSSFNQFQQSWMTYKITKESLTVLHRVVDSGKEDLLHDTTFPGLTHEEFEKWYEQSIRNLDEYIILTLFAIFEQIVIDYLKHKSRIIIEETPKEISKNLHEKVSEKLKFWQPIERLNILKGYINSEQIDNLIKVKNYRDYIAHKDLKKKSPSPPISSESVYDDFYKVIEQLIKI